MQHTTPPSIDELMRLADNYAHVYAFVGDDSMPIARAALRSALEAAVPRWIPTRERLPDLMVPVWGLTRDGEVSVFARDDGGGEGWLWARQTWMWNLAHPSGMEADDDYDVVAWQSLPAAPSPGSEKQEEPHD